MNRMYANTGGRFTSPDKGRMVLNDPSTLNRYIYGSSDPINHTDPTGNYWITQWEHPYLSDNGGFNGAPCGPGGMWAGGGAIALDGGNVWVACIYWVPETTEQAGTGEQTGGGGGSPAPQNAGLMDAARKRAVEMLANPNCAGLYGNEKSRSNGFNPADVLNSILTGGKFGKVKWESHKPNKKGENWVAKASGDGLLGKLPGRASSVTITINTFNDARGLYWNAGDADENALTLLHELGHAFNFLKGAGGFVFGNIDIKGNHSGKYDAEIKEKCLP
jgi:hypothetical protein